MTAVDDPVLKQGSQVFDEVSPQYPSGQVATHVPVVESKKYGELQLRQLLELPALQVAQVKTVGNAALY